MESKKLALLCQELAENRKAENIVILDVRKLSSVTDYFVIASGTSDPHLRAITSEVVDSLWQDHHIRARRVEGATNASWQVLDFFDVIVHIMRAEVREKYNLEGLWGDAPRAGSAKAKAKTKAAPKKSAKPAAKARRKAE